MNRFIAFIKFDIATFSFAGDSTCGQRALYEIGMTGMPVYNVNNNCSTGSTALLLAKQIVEAGTGECVLALGFEKMERGSLSSKVSSGHLIQFFLSVTSASLFC